MQFSLTALMPWVEEIESFGLIKDSIALTSTIIMFIIMLVLYHIYGRKLWIIPTIGIGFLMLANLIDISDEILVLPRFLDRDLESYLRVLGDIIYPFGLLIIVRQLIGMAQTDPLTGLYNRRKLNEILSSQILTAKREHTLISIVFLDIDGFKKINDTFGHLIGDRILQDVAQKLREVIRDGDHLARFGGDEFIISMPNTTQEQATKTIERLNKAVGSIRLPNGEIIRVSAGISQFPDGGDNSNKLLGLASKQMYTNRREKL